jgi:hypothetical protein
MATEQATVRSPASGNGFFATFRSLSAFFKRNLTKRVGVAVIAWRVIPCTAGAGVQANLGRWNGALAMGTVMAVYSRCSCSCSTRQVIGDAVVAAAEAMGAPGSHVSPSSRPHRSRGLHGDGDAGRASGAITYRVAR